MSLGYEDKTTSALIVVNLMTALYGLICIFPLPGAALPAALFSGVRGYASMARYARLGGPFLLIAWFLLARLSGSDVVGAVLNPIAGSIAGFLAVPL